MRSPEGQLSEANILVVSVLEETEQPAVLATFKVRPTDNPERMVHGRRVWVRDFNNERGDLYRIFITCIADKGNVAAAAFMAQILEQVYFDSVFMVGTAAGLQGKVDIGDVVVSTDSVWYYERNYLSDAPVQRPDLRRPKRLLRTSFLGMHTVAAEQCGWKETYAGTLRRVNEVGFTTDIPASRSVHHKAIASGEKILDQDFLSRIGTHNDLVVAGDQEGWGFAETCSDEDRDWMVIRGISDFGDKETRKRMALAASIAASTYLHTFLKHGYRAPKKVNAIIPNESLYVRDQIIPMVCEHLDRAGFLTTGIYFSPKSTLADLVQIVSGTEPPPNRRALRKIARIARASAFDRKYTKRASAEDERYAIKGWEDELERVLVVAAGEYWMKKKACVVGIGNGDEGREIYSQFSAFIGVDIAPQSLRLASKHFPQMKIYRAEAENLRGIETNSIDLYISLRTYQSALFDLRMALYEAYRVLQEKGTCVISVPYKYLMDGRLLEGLLSGGSNELDPDRPYRVADRIRRMMQAANFEKIRLYQGEVEIYIYGSKRTRTPVADPSGQSA